MPSDVTPNAPKEETKRESKKFRAEEEKVNDVIRVATSSLLSYFLSP
jgi:hypothetical protein